MLTINGSSKIVLALCLGLGFWQQSYAEGSSNLEEIVVTARRSEENLQSIPVTVKAFSSETLKQKSISTPEDLQVNTPGVFLSGTGSRQNVIYQIRGQSKSVFGPNSPAVVSYFAEVPDPFIGSFVPQYDMANIQILKGPQGTLFGRNTTGGAILYSPQVATHAFEGYLSATVGNFGKREIQGAVSLPLVQDKLAIRLSGDIDKRDPYTENVGKSDEIDNIDAKAYRLSVLFEPTESLSNTTIYDYYRSDSGGTAQIISHVSSDVNLLTQLGLQASALEQLALQHVIGPYKTSSVIDYSDEKNERSSLINRTEYQWHDLTFVNIFGYRKTELAIRVNTDGMSLLTADGTGVLPAGLPVAYIKADLNDAVEQISNEIQVKGEFAGGNSNWLLGGFWLTSEPDGAQGSAVGFAQIPGAPVTPPSYNFIEETSQAIFGQVSFGLDNWLDGLGFDVGVRFTKDETESCTASGVNSQAGPIVADSSLVVQSDCLNQTSRVVNASNNSTSSEELTWSIGLNWQVNEELFSYIVSRHGYRSGGVNGPTFTGRLAEFQTFEPEKVTDIETGIRADWHVGDIDIRTNIAAFIGRYEDVQSTLTGVQTSGLCDSASADNAPGISPDGDCDASNDPNGGSILVNVGESEVSGVDVDIQLGLTERFVLSFGGNYLDTKTKQFSLSPIFLPYVASQEINFSFAAQKSFTVGARYEINELSFAESMAVNFDYYWIDDVVFSDVVLPDYDLANMRLDISNLLDSGVDIGLFVKNVFDSEYINTASSGGSFIGMTASVYGAPRMAGIQMQYNF